MRPINAFELTKNEVDESSVSDMEAYQSPVMPKMLVVDGKVQGAVILSNNIIVLVCERSVLVEFEMKPIRRVPALSL